jgi:tryptophan halogenase
MRTAARGAPSTVGVIGGGTAGYFTAIALRRRFPDLRVTLVESSAIPVIGVGEATTTLMPPFLHHDLGLDVVELFRAVRPTFKLGIRFDWGPPAGFTYPFGDARPIDAFAWDGDLRRQSVVARLMAEDRGPVARGPDGSLLSLLPSLKVAYHLENRSFVACLAAAARAVGIEHVDTTVEGVDVGDEGITALHTSEGGTLRFDLYIDATGFRSRLLEGALGSPFQSYASTLFCDRAIVATVPQGPTVQPYTTAQTMTAGWCWRIPVRGEDHRGYVHASSFLSEDAAVAEMRACNPGMGEPSVVRFRSGRHRDFWIGNTVAVGNAYGFVEPLESTALHMVIVEIAYITEVLESLRQGRSATNAVGRASVAVGAHWDYLRWFLGVHYRFNGRLDTPFWRAARAEVDVSGLAPAIEQFRRRGPWLATEAGRSDVGDPAFGYSGLMMMLLGQRLEGCELARSTASRDEWEALVARNENVVRHALAQREALEILDAQPEMLRDFVRAPSSWVHREGTIPALLARGATGPAPALGG